MNPKTQRSVQTNRRITAAFLVMLGVAEYVVFSSSFSQFFQGDALFYMSHRFRSWNEFFHGLYTLDIAHWYRPLAAQTIPSVFFHWFGLNPYGYHWVVFLLFFAATCIVFSFLQLLTQSFVAAAAGTAFFGIHFIDVYVTYDFAFAPELFYASFYLLSCIAYLRGTRSNRWYALSILFFVLALMSKEAAVTLPANILLLTILFSPQIPKTRVVPFFAIFAAYYLYIVRFLKVGTGDYVLGLHKDLPARLWESFLWAFDLSRGSLRFGVMAIAVFVGVYALATLSGERRRYTLFGLGWFLIALSPMLGIIGYFGPYYLFLPLTGIAVIVGECFGWLHATVSATNRSLAVSAVCLGLMPFIIAARLNAQGLLYTDIALGYAGRIAGKSAQDLKGAHPAIPPAAIVYILNDDQPNLTRFFGINGLIKLLYADDTIDVRYSSLGHTISDADIKSGKVIVMKYVDEGLVPAGTGEALARREDNVQYDTSTSLGLEVSPAEIKAGAGAYIVRVRGAANTDAELQYRFNEGPSVTETIHLNFSGETRFFVSNETKRGTYRFIGIRIPPNRIWTRTDASITVTD